LALVKKCRCRVEAGARDSGRRVALRARRALAAGAALLVAQAAFAQAFFEPEASVIDAALALARQSATALAPLHARIEATAGALDARLRLAPCARVEPFLAPGLPAWGATRVGLRCVSGRVLWRAFIPVQVQVLAPAWTSKAALPGGAVVATDQWELVETDWAASASPPLGALATIAGRTLARPVNPGQALRESDLQARRWFANGQAVRILATGPGYSIQSEGLALGHGIEGQPVRVRTEAGRILTGQAVGEALVEVRP
jgi:flagella basal body P-ring formation protein FlgA